MQLPGRVYIYHFVNPMDEWNAEVSNAQWKFFIFRLN